MIRTIIICVLLIPLISNGQSRDYKNIVIQFHPAFELSSTLTLKINKSKGVFEIEKSPFKSKFIKKFNLTTEETNLILNNIDRIKNENLKKGEFIADEDGLTVGIKLISVNNNILTTYLYSEFNETEQKQLFEIMLFIKKKVKEETKYLDALINYL
jgi:hypothetical protein